MLRHSLLLFYRNFTKFKSTFFINLLGLSTGLACVLLIYIWAKDEFGMDRFHVNNDRLYQVMNNKAADGTIQTTGYTQDFLASALKEEMPEVKYAAAVTPVNFFPAFVLFGGKDHVRAVAKFADEDFFKIFSYDLKQGNESQVLSNDMGIAISESMAKNLFGDTENALGKTLEWQVVMLKSTVTITGVFADVPANASESFDFVLPMNALRKIINSPADRNWDAFTPHNTFVVVNENADVDAFNDRLANLVATKTGKKSEHTLFLKPFGDTYLYGRYENGVISGGRIEYVKLFVAIAFAILLIACVNFINLFTAKASRRIREVGIKKAIGAERMVLIRQYLGESILMSVVSLVIAVPIVEVVLPQFNTISGKQLSLSLDATSLMVVTGIALVTGILAGTYPALYISGFQPAKILRGQLSTSAGEVWARKGLVVFQFALTMIFIVCVLTLDQQVEYVQSRNIGYDRKNVLFFDASGKIADSPATFISQLKNIPGVVNASSMIGNIMSEAGGGGGMAGSVQWNGKEIIMASADVNYDMLETLGMTIKLGRSFSRDFPTDRDKIIMNEAAIDILGLKDPIGKKVDAFEIIGVVKNFHFESLHEQIKPYWFRLQTDISNTIVVKIEPGREKETIASIQKFYNDYNSGYVFSYEFIDDRYLAHYEDEERVGVLSKYFAGLAIIISCLGLFGLAVFTAERRKKEMSIRKVLGSTEFQIVSLMSRDFTRMVLVAIIIGLPASFLIIRSWLDGFAYKIEISWWYFAVSAMLVILLTWLTVGAQTIKVARVNPADSLRSE